MKNHTQIMVDRLSPDPFLKNQNWAYLRINNLKFHTVWGFFVYQFDDYQNIFKLSYRTFASYKAFLWKEKEVWK